MSDESVTRSPSSNSSERSTSGKVLSNRTIATCAVLVATIAAVAGWLLLDMYGAGTPTDQIRLEAIRTVATIGLGAGGAIALLLAARRQQTAERELVEKRRDLALRERVAADNQEHQRLVAEASERDATERRITDLYSRAADQLGSDKAPVRLAGLYALERVAQDNETQRRTITNVICAYLRMPFTPPGKPPEPDSPQAILVEHRTLVEEREVRLAAQRILTRHLTPELRSQRLYWGGLDIDLTGATLIDFSLPSCDLDTASFTEAIFVGSTNFTEARFMGDADFDEARFAGDAAFDEAYFNRVVTFENTEFKGMTTFPGCEFCGSAYFTATRFVGDVDFISAQLSNGFFDKTNFLGGCSFDQARFRGLARFDEACFAGEASFEGTDFALGLPPEVASLLHK